MNIILVLIIAAASFRCFGGEEVFTPEDPMRTMVDDNKTLNVSALRGKDGWVRFEGKVVEVQPNGIRLQGYYDGYGSDEDTVDFFVAHFPYNAAEGDWVGTHLFYLAKEAGTYTYTTVFGGSRTIRKLEYEIPYTPPPPPPPTPEQIAAAKAKAVADKKANEEKVLKYNQELAAKGDPYGLLRMGERYRDGDGVPTVSSIPTRTRAKCRMRAPPRRPSSATGPCRRPASFPAPASRRPSSLSSCCPVR